MDERDTASACFRVELSTLRQLLTYRYLTAISLPFAVPINLLSYKLCAAIQDLF